MAPLDNNVVPAKGTTFYIGSWVFVADGSGGFDSHLINPSIPKTSKIARHQEVNNFDDQLNEIPLLVHIKEDRNQPDFDVTVPKTLSELEEDLDNLLEITRQEAIVEREAPMSEFHQDPVQDRIELSANTISLITIENCLKDLMAIPRPRVDNYELLDGINRVSSNITDCINLAEPSLRKRKSSIKHKKTSPRSQRTGDIFSGLDHIDNKIASCIKLAGQTLNSGRFSEQDETGFENP